MKCQNCSRTVTRKTKFCPNCGNRIVSKRSEKSTQSKASIPLSYALAFIGVGLVIGIIIANFDSDSGNGSTLAVSNGASSQVIQSSAVLDIAKDFMCPCGSCSDPLDACQCDHDNGALEVKNFIAQKLQEGHKKPHIVEMLSQSYPGLTPNPMNSFQLDLPNSNVK